MATFVWGGNPLEGAWEFRLLPIWRELLRFLGDCNVSSHYSWRLWWQIEPKSTRDGDRPEAGGGIAGELASDSVEQSEFGPLPQPLSPGRGPCRAIELRSIPTS